MEWLLFGYVLVGLVIIKLTSGNFDEWIWRVAMLGIIIALVGFSLTMGLINIAEAIRELKREPEWKT